MNNKVNFLFTMLSFIFFASCTNPLASVEPDIEKFKTNYSQNIQTFQGKRKIMRYAWSGNPKKRALLFIHGSPGSWDGWSQFLLNTELQKNFHIIAIDRPGYGGSDPGNTERLLSLQASDVIEVLKFNHSQLPAILIGHSYGGPVIAKAAVDFPSQVAGLVFVASSVSPDLEDTKWFQIPANWWVVRNIIPSALRVCNEEILALKKELQSLLPDWKKINARVVLIQGEKDTLVPPGNQKFLIDHLDSKNIIKVYTIQDLNHFVPWKRPDLIIGAINILNKQLTDDSL